MVTLKNGRSLISVLRGFDDSLLNDQMLDGNLFPFEMVFFGELTWAGHRGMLTFYNCDQKDCKLCVKRPSFADLLKLDTHDRNEGLFDLLDRIGHASLELIDFTFGSHPKRFSFCLSALRLGISYQDFDPSEGGSSI